MESSLFKLTSLNLNGIRSATSKGLEPWLAAHQPDCICVQEVKAQAEHIEGTFKSLAGLKGYFHLAEKKGYSGVGVYTKHEPSDVVIGYGSPEFGAVVKQAGVEKIRAHAPGFGLELAKAQHAAVDGELHKRLR